MNGFANFLPKLYTGTLPEVRGDDDYKRKDIFTISSFAQSCFASFEKIKPKMIILHYL